MVRKISLVGGSPGLPPKRAYKTYLIRNCETNHIKIGRTVDVAKRLANLSAGSVADLELVHVFPQDIEHELHTRFARLRVKGGEWFESSPGLEEFIRRARAATPPAKSP